MVEFKALKTCEVCGETSEGGHLHNQTFHRLDNRISAFERPGPTNEPTEGTAVRAGFRLAPDLLGVPTFWCIECGRDSGFHYSKCSKSSDAEKHATAERERILALFLTDEAKAEVASRLKLGEADIYLLIAAIRRVVRGGPEGGRQWKETRVEQTSVPNAHPSQGEPAPPVRWFHWPATCSCPLCVPGKPMGPVIEEELECSGCVDAAGQWIGPCEDGRQHRTWCSTGIRELRKRTGSPMDDLVCAPMVPKRRDPAPSHVPPELDALLHVLWTRAVGTPGYVKSDWRDLEHAIYKLGTP